MSEIESSDLAEFFCNGMMFVQCIVEDEPETRQQIMEELADKTIKKIGKKEAVFLFDRIHEVINKMFEVERNDQ